MKLSKRTTSIIGCLWLAVELVLFPVQIIFLTLKLASVVGWGWWATLIPTFCLFGLPLAIVVIAVLVLAPKVLIENIKRRKRIEAEAKRYGMARKPGESDGELKKRIIQRNMIMGNYSRKDIKDEILRNFPNVGSCQILIDNQNDEIVIIPRHVYAERETISDEELQKIAEFTAEYIPTRYKITIQRAKE